MFPVGANPGGSVISATGASFKMTLRVRFASAGEITGWKREGPVELEGGETCGEGALASTPFVPGTATQFPAWREGPSVNGTVPTLMRER